LLERVARPDAAHRDELRDALAAALDALVAAGLIESR
jgi:hypothetical protein